MNSDEIKRIALSLSDTMQCVINELTARQSYTDSAKHLVARMKKEYEQLCALCNNYGGLGDTIRIDGQIQSIQNVIVGVYLFSKEVERQAGVYIGLNMYI